MDSCIICGKSVGGPICDSHQEDVVFEFEGSRAGQLKPGRYYRGEVDGFAEFGVFVDIARGVTGLLHRSELDRRLESLDWDAGDTVYVQVTDVRDNGNVDLGWSIRQKESEFRGALVQEPEGDRLKYDDEDEDDTEESATPSRTHSESEERADGPTAAGETDAQVETDDAPDDEDEPAGAKQRAAAASGGGSTAVAEETAEAEGETAATADAATDETTPESGVSGDQADADVQEDPAEAELRRASVESLERRVGDVVRIEGEVVSIRQTSGPTVFELRDESGTVECAAFEEAGVRAYPEVEREDVVRLEGEVERRHGSLQVETEALVVLAGDERETVHERLEAALEDEARPERVELLAEHDAVGAVEDEVVEAATAIRRAVKAGTPVVVRHRATADGYVAGSAIERAVLPLIREEHAREDAQYHFFERRPIDEPVYDMDAATKDVTDMLEDRERHGQRLPLVVLVGIGSTEESTDAYGLLDVYGVDRIVVDDGAPDESVLDEVSTMVNAALAGDAADVTASALAANVAAHVNDDAREEVAHLPAVSYWDDTPEVYATLADEAGVDAEAAATLRDAVALEAYYQSYSDKRELITDILFSDDRNLAGHVAEQFREKVETELETAENNLSAEEALGVTFSVLDTDRFSHRFDFPPTELLLDELHRRQRADTEETLVTIGIGDDELHVRSTEPVDVRQVAEDAGAEAPEAGLTAVGGRDGSIEFLSGEREAVLNAVIAAVAEQVA